MGLDRRTFIGWVTKSVAAMAAAPQQVATGLEAMAASSADLAPEQIAKILVGKTMQARQLMVDTAGVKVFLAGDVDSAMKLDALSGFARGRLTGLVNVADPAAQATKAAEEIVRIYEAFTSSNVALHRTMTPDVLAALRGCTDPRSQAIMSALDAELGKAAAGGAWQAKGLKEIITGSAKDPGVSADGMNDLIEAMTHDESGAIGAEAVKQLQANLRNSMEAIYKKAGIEIKPATRTSTAETSKTTGEAPPKKAVSKTADTKLSVGNAAKRDSYIEDTFGNYSNYLDNVLLGSEHNPSWVTQMEQERAAHNDGNNVQKRT